MADIGVTTDEGAQLLFERAYNGSSPDWGANLLLGLFKNTSGLSSTSVLADVVPITGGNYAPVVLPDNEWVAAGSILSRAQVLVSATGTPFDGVYGSYIFSTGTTPRLVHFIVSALAPVAVAAGESYPVDISNVLD